MRLASTTGSASPERIGVFRSRVSPEAIERAAAVLASGCIGQGAQVRAFESALAQRLGARNCVAVSSGTAALHLALDALDLPSDAEVVTTAMTWIATHHAIEYVGARPILADIDAATGNVDPQSVERRIGERTRALVAVHYSGYPCDLGELRAIADRHGLPLIEDAAQAMGASYGARPIGGGANLQTLSFGPTKNLTAIHGGAVMTGDDDQAQRLRALRSLGQTGGASSRVLRGGPSYRTRHELNGLGYRYEMPDVHAAVGLGQRGVLDSENARRDEIAAAYAGGLAGLPGLELPGRRPDRRSSNHFFPVLVERRDDLAVALHDHGIDVGVHYPLNPRVAVAEGTIPNAERFAARTLTLPLHPSLTARQVERVVEAVREGW